jgi:hypothetical protein
MDNGDPSPAKKKKKRKKERNKMIKKKIGKKGNMR